MREACGAAHLKAILGTGDLKTLRNVYAASMVAMQAGADFIKTSTGKEDVNATLPVSLVMLRALRDYRDLTRLRDRLQAGGRPAHRQGRDQLADPDARGNGPAPGRATTSSASAPARCSPTSSASSNISRPAAIPRAIATRWDRPMGKIADLIETLEYGPSPESDDAVRGWLAAHSRPASAISSTAASPSRPTLFDVFDPATGEKIARVSQGSEADVDAAVAAARKALPGWSALPGDARARHLYALARHVQKRERFLSVLESIDNGKPIRETRDIDIPLVARHFYHHAGWASLIASEFPGARPVGVCGQIIPWNFPLLMLAWKIAPALAAGNTVVLKPAEFTPLTALAFAEICVEAGLPPGVVNIVTGDGATGAAIVAHHGVDKIAFTGSTEVGRLIRKATAGTGKKLSLELGGKSPFIVFDDADLDSAVEGVVDAIWFNQGQVCCAGSRLLVAESVAEKFTRKLRAAHGDSDRRRSPRQVDRHRRDRRAGSARAHPAARRGGPRGGRARSISRKPSCPRAAASIRRRWLSASSPPRCWRARKSSGPCW